MGVSIPAYARPGSLADALDAAAGGSCLVLAGGTDIYPAHATRPIERPVLDISGIDGLRGITVDGTGAVRIGALTTWTELAGSSELGPAFDGLRTAARQVGGRQIQNTGTIAGNLVSASPAADGTPNLLVLEAAVELASAARGVRHVPLRSFVTGYRATTLAPDELVTAVVVPAVPGGAGAVVRSTFRKLGGRAYLVISVVSVAAALAIEGGVVRTARVAVGACSPIPVRLPALEAALEGRPADARLADLVAAARLEPLSPIDDVRAPAGYRTDAAATLVRRALRELVA